MTAGVDFKSLAACLNGKFIVLDGPDGCGKSTQVRLIAERLRESGGEPVVCRDPGGTEIGDRIRSVLLDYDLSTMDVHCETLLFMASRAQLMAEVVQPALEANRPVICDRFITSTCAYQGAAGYDPKRVIDLAPYAIGDCWPDATVILDVDVAQGFDRIAGRRKSDDRASDGSCGQAGVGSAGSLDAMESRSDAFHQRVRELFLDVHTYYPTPVVTVDGRGDIEAVGARVAEVLLRVVA